MERAECCGTLFHNSLRSEVDPKGEVRVRQFSVSGFG